MSDNLPRPRQKVLFLTFTYPTSAGSGSQLRSAALVRMLAAQADIHLLIAGYVWQVGGPADREIEGLCKGISYLRIYPSPATGGVWPPLNTEVPVIDLPTIDCAYGEVGERIVRFYREHEFDSLFLFRFEALHFIYQQLDAFPVRHLDLDELASRRQDQVIGLEQDLPPTAWSRHQKTVKTTVRIMERMFLPRFHRVFVASAAEAEHVRRITGFPRAQVLPNAYPVPLAPPEKRTTSRDEILFVGTLSYHPNVDALLYFCSEILPIIRAKRDVLFRVAGMGGTDALDCIRSQPGVEMMGYQENLEPLYREAALVAVPLRAGTGTRFKILEAFARGRPVVSTSIGAEGLEVTHRKNILLADNPAAFAQACLELLEAPELAAQLCEDAARLQRERYSDEALARCYAKIAAPEPIP